MPSRLPVIQLSTRDQEEIGRWLTSHGTPQQVALRSRIVLAAAAGRSDSAVAQELEINRKTVMLWRRRFAQEGIDSLWEVAPGRGRKPTFGPDKIEAIVNATLQAKPKGMRQWSCRLMAKNQNVSKSTVSNIWRSHNLKPHRVKSFKLSREARCADEFQLVESGGTVVWSTHFQTSPTWILQQRERPAKGYWRVSGGLE